MIRAVIASTIVLGLAGLAATLAHRASASVRHAIWFVGLVTALGVGALAAAGPLIEVESSFVKSPGVSNVPADVRESFRGTAAPTQSMANQAPRAIARSSAARIRTDSLLIALWAMGVAFIIGRALFAHVAVARLISRSRHLDADLRLDVDASIDVRLSHDIHGPFTLGAWRPVILLPLDAEYWTSERLRIVLVHEAAHVARLDYIAQLVATVACAIYWFNPITWLAASRLRAEAEHAADDRVLAAGVDGVTYATHLLALAQPGRAPLSTPTAVRMARGTTRLEKRFTAMLDSQRSRGIVPLRLQAAIGSAAMLVAVPFTSMRLIPVEPKAPPITLSEPAPLTVVAPVVMTTGKPVVPNPRQAKPTQSTRSLQQADTIVERTVAASPGETISINLRSVGGVTIRSWNQSQVRVRAMLSGTLARQTQVLMARVGGGVELRTVTPPEYRGDWIDPNSFEIWVPTRFNVHISSPGGGISISGVEGRFSGNTAGGGITLDNVSGRADLTTGGGEVSVTNSNLEGRVSTGGGRAVVHKTSGPISVTSGSGPVIRDGGSGVPVAINGSVDIKAIDGDTASVCAPTQRALADFGFGLACARCVIDQRAPVWMVFHLPPGLHDIRAGGPASGKIVQGDTLLAIDGMDITSPNGSERFSMARPGDSVELTVRRNGALLTTTIVAGARCAPGISQPREVTYRDIVRPRSAPDSNAARRGWIGVALVPAMSRERLAALTAARQPFPSFPLVGAVAPGSPAATAGLEAGDRLIAVNGASLRTTEGATSFRNTVPGVAMSVSYVRRGKEYTTTVVPGRAPADRPMTRRDA
jgi:beta-lactamase regulating signal transducer with metallopeptidase domain